MQFEIPELISENVTLSPGVIKVRVKEESEKVGLKLNIQKIKMMASGLNT